MGCRAFIETGDVVFKHHLRTVHVPVYVAKNMGTFPCFAFLVPYYDLLEYQGELFTKII